MITTWTVFDGFRRHYDNARARFGEEENLASLMESRRLLLSGDRRQLLRGATGHGKHRHCQCR
jgi:hypothetical protein